MITAATRSRPECKASERTPKLPVRRTRKVFRQTSSSAEPTLRRAARFFSWMSSCSRREKGMRKDYLKSVKDAVVHGREVDEQASDKIVTMALASLVLSV